MRAILGSLAQLNDLVSADPEVRVGLEIHAGANGLEEFELGPWLASMPEESVKVLLRAGRLSISAHYVPPSMSLTKAVHAVWIGHLPRERARDRLDPEYHAAFDILVDDEAMGLLLTRLNDAATRAGRSIL